MPTKNNTPFQLPPLDDALIAAYAQTHFWVHVSPSVGIKAGEQSAALQDLLTRLDADCGFFITAHNPYSRPTSDVDNAAAHEALYQQLALLGVHALEATGQSPAGDWPDEQGFFVCGLSQTQALSLGQQFGQNAIVWCSLEHASELLFPARG